MAWLERSSISKEISVSGEDGESFYKTNTENVELTLFEATARSTKLRKMQSYKSVFYQKKM